MTRRAHLIYSAFCLAFALSAIVERATAQRQLAVFRREPSTLWRASGEDLSASRLLIPVAGVARSELRDSFGAPRAGHRHAAIDILADRGTPALAAVDGTVIKLYTSRAGGLTVYLADDSGMTVYYYAHLDGYAPGLRESQRVHAGQILGYVGTTGNAPPDRPHLHFGIERLPPTGEWWKGVPVDPYPILMSGGVEAGR